MKVEGYINENYLEKLGMNLEREIRRTKDFVNSNGYHNGTALNIIVRNYRTELKQYLKTVQEDYSDLTKGEGTCS